MIQPLYTDKIVTKKGLVMSLFNILPCLLYRCRAICFVDQQCHGNAIILSIIIIKISPMLRKELTLYALKEYL